MLYNVQVQENLKEKRNFFQGFATTEKIHSANKTRGNFQIFDKCLDLLDLELE